MTTNPYEATIVPERKPRPRKEFSWLAFMIVLLGGQFLYNWSVITEVVSSPAYVASSMTARTLIIAIVAMAVGKMATRF